MNRTKENTWRKLNNQPQLKSVKDIMHDLEHYVSTYMNQYGAEEYSDETIINDILFGLGRSLSDEYNFAPGFEKFKDRLLEHIKENKA